MMSKITFFILFSILCIGQIFAQYTSIPDSCFESILVSQNIDSDNTVNGQVLTSDIDTITTLDISSDFHTCQVNDITGIEDFNLLEILFVNDANLSSIDMSSNLQLKRLYCKNNDITQLNVTQNSLLERLDCRDNVINTIDVTQNLNLKRLNVRNNNLSNLNVNSNIQLEVLHCEVNQLSTIDVSQNDNLFLLGLHTNQILDLNLTPLIHLIYLSMINNLVSQLNTDSNTQLQRLRFSENQITNIDLTNNPQLNWLWCQDNNLTELDLSQNPLLDILNCSNNQLAALNVQNGANSLLTGTYLNAPFGYEDRFMADGNANLSCILVDDATYSASNWLSIDSASTFVESQNACDALSINEFGKLSFSVYPNPANTHFSLQGNFKIKNIELFSVLGNLVKRFEFTQDKYAIDSLESGLYLVKITTHNNGVFTYKLIKE